ncbi:MotA/TolQ/ExbB proton channel family protein [Aquimarina sp. AU474]|uniref:MotA/TolQ/ExbB proton channel family protein n=1 Tax=Aquimarina sp. AU474 TaxID=2108529 RepID=UPI00135C2375|nr:MotA/TolQ/ExbB proton channel family protein [Aquimarina sp. AU474]
MILFSFLLLQSRSLFFGPFGLLQDGGMFFMFPILLMLLLVLFLTLKNFLVIRQQGFPSAKYIKLINSIGLLTLVWGVLGQLVGLVEAFDKIELLGEISTPLLAGGLKISALSTIFGFFVFVVSRVSSIIFTWMQKEESNQ